MHDNRDDYEPIIADRRSREPLREDTQPLWRLVLALGAGVAVVVLLVWWLMDRSSSDGAWTTAPLETSAPVIHVEEAPAAPARDLETDTDIAQAPPPASGAEPATGAEHAATPPENIPEVVPDDAVEAPAPSAPASVRFMSPDTQVRFELLGPLDSSPSLTSNVGDVLDVAPGTWRVTASGAQLETFEQEVTFDGERAYEYTVELCAERQYERENFAGRIVEERACTSTAQCESMFLLLSEQAARLVKDLSFRNQQCANWRPNAAPEGKWTLDTRCGGATLATTCRIEIAEGACTSAEPRRSVHGAACPRTELK